jgi:hypothetical protein
MSKVTVFVGLDLHKDTIQVCAMDSSGQVLANRRCPNDAAELALLVAFFGDQVRGAIEACSVAADLADELVERHAWDIDLAHPGYVNRMGAEIGVTSVFPGAIASAAVQASRSGRSALRFQFRSVDDDGPRPEAEVPGPGLGSHFRGRRAARSGVVGVVSIVDADDKRARDPLVERQALRLVIIAQVGAAIR